MRLALLRAAGLPLALTGDPVMRLAYRPWRDDPTSTFRRMRERPQPWPVTGGMLAVATAAACRDVLRDRRMSVRTRGGGSPGGAVPDARDPLLEPVDLSFLVKDPPEHTRLRRLVSGPFTPARIAEREPSVTRIAERLVEDAVRRDEFDLVTTVATPVPVAVIADLLGIPEDATGPFARWGRAVGAGLGGVRSMRALRGVQEAVVELRALLGDLLERRRADPTDDLLSHLASADATAEETVTLAVLLLLAGFETTSTLIGNAVAAMLDARGPWERLVADPAGLAAGVVEETLRFDAPIQFSARVPHTEIEVGGHTVAPDTAVLAMIGAAGRDPAVHSAPDAFEPERSTVGEHLAFSGGLHYCLGAPLARMEARVVLVALATRAPRLRRLRGATRRRSLLVRGYEALPLAA